MSKSKKDMIWHSNFNKFSDPDFSLAKGKGKE